MSSFQEWFRLADRQSTGMVTGQDAVQFFSRSGLPKRLLAQVWEFADTSRRGCLSYEEFVVALRLIAFVQSTPGFQAPGYAINVQQARMTLSNPSFAGVPILQGLGGPPQAAGGQAQQQQQAPTGAGNSPGESSLDAQEVAKFRQVFAQLDTDKDGFVAGSDCFPVFMKSGLDKSVLRHVWDLVAGNEGKLNEQQFLMSQQLIILACKGEKLPAKLPASFSAPSPPAPGQPKNQFAGVAANAAAVGATAAGAGDMQQGGQQMFQQQQQQQQPQFQMPGALPSPAMVSPVAGEFQYKSATPPMPGNFDNIGKSEQLKMEEAHAKARKADEEKQKALFEMMQNQKNKDMFRDAMQELVIFKSRADAELIQLSAQSRLEEQELEKSKKMYENLFSQYGDTQKRYKDQYDNLMSLNEEKSKLVAEIEGLTNQSLDENEFAAPLQQVQSEIAVLKDQLMQMRQADLQRKQKEQSVVTEAQIERQNLQREIETYKMEVEGARMEAERQQGELVQLRNQAQEVLTRSKIEKQALSAVLGNSGQIFHVLSQAALKCGVEIPTFGQLKLEWSEGLASNAEEWNMDELNEGYTVVENLGELSLNNADNAASFNSEIPVQVSLGESAAKQPTLPVGQQVNGKEENPLSNLGVAAPTNRSIDSGSLSQRSDFGMQDMFASSSPNSARSEDLAAPAPVAAAAPTDGKGESAAAAGAPENAGGADWFSFDS
ncbi:hypothetical protein HOP50_04g33410 [Chloropicon primus]|uniref:EF-hand domain-containing protein n=1 Tax=Chloropicon primus TaxID=1764295 RepID=A0A5B8MND4_9CHLO|nr:hypothetical protein A3770_04p33380 [Chloropicon primus]UPR00032.1 hypothetical protein HOP50_04g33410 [Chloropicon primus]|mmetsp:Transcript_14534/g.41404  ORF Transcript_14534/g.41404 Transcript_14534/m.41404 type:complete len:717 (+) Transcript_14534:64-2214(+)|eukprot:QDZ20820.1 hypothetical protein A3770_04p33380 [Chloropicon primus]